MTEEFPFNDDDVISMSPNVTGSGQLLKIGVFKQAIKQNLSKYAHAWLDEGIECEVLSIDNGGWQKGRVYLRLEYVPDPPKK